MNIQVRLFRDIDLDAPKPSKDMMDMIREHTDKTYDLAIDHCINMIKNYWVNDGVNTYSAMLSEIMQALNNLKNKSNG